MILHATLLPQWIRLPSPTASLTYRQHAVVCWGNNTTPTAPFPKLTAWPPIDVPFLVAAGNHRFSGPGILDA
jgi:hypothetical protein